MALTVTNILKTMVEDRYLVISTVDFDSSYPTNGEALTDATLGLNDDNLDVFVFPRLGYTFDYVKADQKLKAFYGDNDNASDGPQVEVANATNLATLTGVQVLALGRNPA